MLRPCVRLYWVKPTKNWYTCQFFLFLPPASRCFPSLLLRFTIWTVPPVALRYFFLSVSSHFLSKLQLSQRNVKKIAYGFLKLFKRGVAQSHFLNRNFLICQALSTHASRGFSTNFTGSISGFSVQKQSYNKLVLMRR